jgi:hypothetical protein
MPEKTTVSGEVSAVRFDCNRSWFLSVQLLDYVADDGDGWYQLDGATFAWNGLRVERWELMDALIGEPGDYAHPGKYRSVRVTITGTFGPYPTVDRAEFVETRPPQQLEVGP